MRKLILVAAIAVAAFCTFSGSPELTLGAPVIAMGAVAVGRREEVVEFVLYKGAFGDESRQPLLSTPSLELAQHARLNELHDAAIAGRHDLVFCIGARECSYELDSKGKRMAQGSTCHETEVTS